MPIDFHYTPPSPEALSGPSFIDQTEQAINDLGMEFDRLSDELVPKTDEALEAARKAEALANNALLTAQEAEGQSQSALNDTAMLSIRVDGLASEAGAARDRADEAYDLAALADSRAGQGLAESAEVRALAVAAQSRADEALAGSAEAQALAAAAQNRADEAYDLAAQAGAEETAALAAAAQSRANDAYNLAAQADSKATQALALGGELARACPAGQVASFARPYAPDGWLPCNGSAVSRSTYAALFQAISTYFGAGDGWSTFNIPDLRGEFVRGWDAGRTLDYGRAFASVQGDAIRNMTGYFATIYSNSDTAYDDGVLRWSAIGAFGWHSGQSHGSPNATGVNPSFDASRQVPTAGENRPRNVALLYCIKY